MWNEFFQQVKVQQMHELKKKEKEYIKLQVKYCLIHCYLRTRTSLQDCFSHLQYLLNATWLVQERLNQVMMEKKKESKTGIEIMNLLQVFF